MSDKSPTLRGDLMRRIAAIHAENVLLANAKLSDDQRAKRTQELNQQLADLTKGLLGP